jgi:hypothetical protein
MLEKKLNREDGKAVDLLLDEQAINLSDSGVFVKSVDIDPQRVRTVKQVLDLLKEMPAEEPSADLAGRTIRRIDALSAANGSAILRPTSVGRPDDQRPQA